MALLLGLGIVPAAAAQPSPLEPPVVEVLFQVAPGSRFDRSAPQRDGARKLITTHLAGLGVDHFGFMRWSAAVQKALPPPRALGLIVRLVDVSQGAGKDKVLMLLGWSDNQEIGLGPLKSTLYPWSRKDLPEDAAGLARDVNAELSRLFARDDFRRELHERFFAAVPLATVAEPDLELKRIVVPVSWDGLRVASTAVLRVEFEVGGQRPRSETLMISGVQKRFQAPHLGGLEATILALNGIRRDWGDDIPTLLDRQSLRKLAVFMETYVRRHELRTQGGVVTRISGGGR